MRAPAIVPTVTQRVRFFLGQQGAALRPWTGLQDTYDELYALLRRRRSDPEFWQPLKGLLREVVDSAAASQRRGRQASNAAELLQSWQVDELVDELRDAMPRDAGAAEAARTDFTRTLSSAVLGGFLLLGLAAAGCSGDPDGNAIVGTGGSVGFGGQSSGGTGAGGVVSSGGSDGAVDVSQSGLDGSGPKRDGPTAACIQGIKPELDRAIGEANLTENDKSLLCACFSALSTEWTTSLTQLFASGTPEEISTMLSGLVGCCRSSGGIVGPDHHASASPTTTNLGYIRDGQGDLICYATPIYKGVSFAD
jgi:hypothetical protein